MIRRFPSTVEVFEGSVEHLDHLRREVARLRSLVRRLGGDPDVPDPERPQ